MGGCYSLLSILTIPSWEVVFCVGWVVEFSRLALCAVHAINQTLCAVMNNIVPVWNISMTPSNFKSCFLSLLICINKLVPTLTWNRQMLQNGPSDCYRDFFRSPYFHSSDITDLIEKNLPLFNLIKLTLFTFLFTAIFSHRIDDFLMTFYLIVKILFLLTGFNIVSIKVSLIKIKESNWVRYHNNFFTDSLMWYWTNNQYWSFSSIN